jgi:hypothetical protein
MFCVKYILSITIIMFRQKIKLLKNIIIFTVFWSSVAAENEVTLSSIVKHKCDDKILNWDISSATMHNIAYMWTHQQDMDTWEYKEDYKPILFFPESDCRIIEYETNVQVPKVFSEYMPSKMSKTHILKKVCATSQVLKEKVQFSKILFIGSFEIDMIATIDNHKNQTLFTGNCDIELPWFALPIKSAVFRHVKNSMIEYINLLSNSLCL